MCLSRNSQSAGPLDKRSFSTQARIAGLSRNQTAPTHHERPRRHGRKSVHRVLDIDFEFRKTGKTPPRGRKGQWPHGIVQWPGTRVRARLGFSRLLRQPARSGPPVVDCCCASVAFAAVGWPNSTGFLGARVFSSVASFAAPPGTAMRGRHRLGSWSCRAVRLCASGSRPGPGTRNPLLRPAWRTGRHRSTKKAAPGK